MNPKKTILITGCSHGGIGYATACYLKKLGHNIITSVRGETEFSLLKSEGFECIKLDVLSTNDINDMFEYLKDRVVDVIFNNAGYMQTGALEDLPTNILRKQFETNFFAIHEITCLALKKMRRQGHGIIIQHSSVLGLVPIIYQGAYNASKYALEGLADTMRLEIKNPNIFMTTLNTGPVTSLLRENSMRYMKNINLDTSIHKSEYKKIKLNLHKKIPFNKEAISVAKTVEKILNSKKPKPRYAITKFTYIAIILKRVCSTKFLDYIFKKIR